MPDIGQVSDAVMKARHLIITGLTSTGKTRMLRNLLSYAPLSAPVVVLEESPEIPNHNPIEHLEINTEMLARYPETAYPLARSAAIRNGAGILVYGEISLHNSKDVTDALCDEQGPTVLATMHAQSPAEANLILPTRLGTRTPPLDMGSVAIMHMQRIRTGERVISDLVVMKHA